MKNVSTLHNSIFLSSSTLYWIHCIFPLFHKHFESERGLEGNEQLGFGNWNVCPSLFHSQQHPVNCSRDDLFHIPVGMSSPCVNSLLLESETTCLIICSWEAVTYITQRNRGALGELQKYYTPMLPEASSMLLKEHFQEVSHYRMIIP